MFGLSLGWVVAAVLGGIVAGRFIKRTDDKIEERRENALEVASVLEQRGLQIIPGVIRAYAIGNYSKIAKELRVATIKLNDKASAEAMFDDLYTKLHNAKVAKAAEVAKIAAEAAKVAPITATAKPVASA